MKQEGKEELITIKTSSGFDCTIAEDGLNDMRILDAMVELQIAGFGDKLIALKTILERLMGTKQKEALYTHLEKIKGRATIQDVQTEINSILANIGESKKK